MDNRNGELTMDQRPLVVLDPTIAATGEKFRLANRLNTLEGAVVGLLWNRKRSGDALLEEIGEILASDYGVRSTVIVEKHSSSRLAQPDLFKKLDESCDAAISGIGDCGSSASFSVCDALEIERKGTPAAALVTEALRSNAAATAERLGAADCVLATVPHPIASLLPAEIREIARDVAPLITRILQAKHVA